MVDKPSAPGYSMGTSKKAEFAVVNGVPGPGTYQAFPPIIYQKQEAKISKQKRFNTYQTFTPGPGTYKNLRKLDHIPMATLKSRLKQKIGDDFPGPGTYQGDPIKFMKSQSTFKIGHDKQRKMDVPKSILGNPGPGNYEVDKSTLVQDQHQGVKFGPERKIVLDIDKKNPGPGQYNQTAYYNGSQASQPKYRFPKSERAKSTNNLTLPGPGVYDSKGMFEESKQNGRGFSIGEKSPKGSSIGVVEGPGPGQYNAHQKILGIMKKTSPSFSMSKNPKLQIDNIREFLSKPGPQTYNYRAKTESAHSFTLGKEKRKGMEIINDAPGPGQYTIQKKQSQPAFSATKGARTNFADRRGNPGPGQYEPKDIINAEYSNVSLGKDIRRTFEIREKLPGPGQYNQQQNKPKKGYTMGHKIRGEMPKGDGPGPGNYTIPSTVSNLPNYSRKH